MSARVALTVAGSDPSGGAGIQADLATFAGLATYGTAVLTGLTAQNTHGVTGVHPVPAAFVTQQLDTLLDDVAVHAAKTGMLGSAAVVHAVVDVLARRPVGPLVVDPVMVATSGDALIDDDAVDAVRTALLPIADLVTPNVPEAARLLGTEPARTVDDLRDQAVALLALGPGAVLVKGGHLARELGEGTDVLAVRQADGTTAVHLSRRPLVDTSNTHGTGCTLSAALAAEATTAGVTGAAPDWPVLVETARDVLQAALLHADRLHVGSGNGPVSHGAHAWGEL
ncbi:bifunctional hydroxymethylpyrimidine kinase/phosphomethylpyrimidine kinase [Klenkia brasiliensis]|uniref:Hydroxymethylpyrimidine/phosphomethylpyrimidine kinase n=1 Tax=Klenkia brasiliensis TaxID=333142 RepID=A0A1G7XIR3_9ACTN|nr:bifunctional hydroxymethylpyrimidine kinase/phosphomethylpyrimidine kinase [Klenkia brasiliensis]SDG84139.1 hydroxymethylpyrimidine/phosphomethylpyrimidine kinase [Klenkia brasiliensis]